MLKKNKNIKKSSKKPFKTNKELGLKLGETPTLFLSELKKRIFKIK